MPRPIHFEIPADDPERAMRFYEQVFGWGFQRWDGPMPYWLVQTGAEGPGIDGGLHARAHPGQGPVNTIDVASCDEYLGKIEAAGGRAVVPKMAIPLGISGSSVRDRILRNAPPSIQSKVVRP